MRRTLALLLVLGTGIACAAVLGAPRAGARRAVVPHLKMDATRFGFSPVCTQQTISVDGTATSQELGAGTFSTTINVAFSGTVVKYSEAFSATFGNTVVRGSTQGTGQGVCGPNGPQSISGSFRTTISTPQIGAGDSTVTVSFATLARYSHTFTPDAAPPTTTTQPTTTQPTTTTTPPPSRITAVVASKWSAGTTFTKVVLLRVESAPAGAAVTLTCTGTKKRGCPFTKRAFTAAASGSVTLTKAFKSAKLKPNAGVEVRITSSGTIGKVVRYTIQKKKAPRAKTLCLAPGATAPRPC